MDNENETNIVIIDQLKVTSNSFDYVQFLTSENQSEYFKNYMYILANQSAPNLRYFIIKRQMRNLDWKFLSSSGILQENFITCIFTIKQLVENGIISYFDRDAYLPIKIFHYLVPQLLCKYNNLSNLIRLQSKNTDESLSSNSSDSESSYNIYDETDSSESSSSDSSYSSDQYKPFYEYFIDLINEDKKEYQSQSNKILNPSSYNDSVVHLYDFLENQTQYNFNNSCFYTTRSYDTIQIEGERINEFGNQEHYSQSKSLSYWTRQRKYIGNVNIVYDDYETQSNGEQILVKKSYNKEYITGQQRNVGIDKTELLKNQNITLNFTSCYSMDQICQYYKFDGKTLLDNKDGLYALRYKDHEYKREFCHWAVILQNHEVEYNYLENLFKYQTLDTNDTNFKQFYNFWKQRGCLTTEVLTTFGLYQKIDYKIQNSQIIPEDNETYDNLTKYTNGQYSGSYIRTLGVSEKKYGAIYPVTKQFLNVNNDWFTSPTYRYNYGSIRGNTISLYYDYLQNITEEADFYKTRTDNIITVNVDQQKKIEMIKRIDQAKGSSSDIVNISIYYPNNRWYDTNQEELKSDQNGKFIKLYTYKYDQYYVGLKQKTESVYQYYHSSCHYKEGQNLCDKKYTRNKNYFIVGTKQLMCKYHAIGENLLSVKVYIKDIVCIMDNKCLATKKLYVE